MERRRAAGALLALAACILCTAAAPTASNHTALDLYDGEPEGCYYNFQHYGEGDRIMTNEPCLNCTCHNRMLMCYLRVCPFTKPIGQDCTVEKRADQCCPIVTCPDVPVDLLTLTSTTSPAEYGATGLGKLDKYGCSIDGKYFPEGSKVPPTPNKPCEHCYCIRNMTTCVMQECTLHVDGCTPIYHKDVCCPVRYSCDHLEDEILLLDDKTTTVRPTPGFLLTTTNSPVTQFTQDCVHDDQIFSDGALIKTEKACEHCYCMKGDIVCVVQECGTPMENEGKNCTSLPPREGQCCPDTYICEGDELNTEFPTDLTTEYVIEDITTLSPPRRVGVEGSGYRKEPDNISFVEPHPTEPTHEGSGDSHESEQAMDLNDVFTTEDSTKYIHSTVPSTGNVVKEDSEKVTSARPSAAIPSSTDILVSEDNVKTTTISNREDEITQEDTAKLEKTEITSSIPSYDHKLETSQPDVQSVTESEIVVHDNKITLTTIASDLEKTTTVKPHEENIVTDAVLIQHNKYPTTTVVPILEDEGITTELDREQQMISTGPIEEHTYEPGLHTASTTSAPFLEEVEGIPTGTYGQNVISDGITESDVYDFTKDKSEPITTPAVGDNDNLVDKNENTGVEATTIPEKESHKLVISTTNVPILEEVEKTSTVFPVDLVTSKSSEETYEGDKFISTSTHQPIALENEEKITENIKESPATTQIPESSDSQKLDDKTQKYENEKYDQVTDQKTYGDYGDISTTPSGSVIDQKDEEVIKTNEEPVTVLNYDEESKIKDTDKQIITSSSAPIDNENLLTLDDKDINKPQVLDTAGPTKPAYINDSERVTTQETSIDISTEKKHYQEESQTVSPTSAPITEEIEMATTEFIKDQDFVTTALMEQESIKPGEYIPSTSSTPFLEEIEKQTTEVTQGHVVTDVIVDKEDIKPPKHVIYATETTLPLETEYIATEEPDKGSNTIPSGTAEEAESTETPAYEKTTQPSLEEKDVSHPHEEKNHDDDITTTVAFSSPDDLILKEDKNVATTEPSSRKEDENRVVPDSSKIPELFTDISVESTPATESFDHQVTKSPTKPLSEESHDNLGTIPSQELTTETSKIEENTSEKEIKPDVEAVTLSTQITPTLTEITTINLGENEIDEDNILPPGRIPGEGDCLLNGITYRNESIVPSTNKCHSDCRCVSSIIKCSPIICSSPPEYMDNCQPTYDSPDSCCPTYVCDQFRETLPPMPHIQITTTELPQQPSSIDCRGDQCNIEEDRIQSTVSSELCANKDCGIEIDKKTDTNSCGPHGCIASHSTPELCTGDNCGTGVKEECVNGDCKHLPATDSEVQCEGKNCESSEVNIPLVPECENGICKNKVLETIPVIVPCTEEGGCKGTEVNVAQDCADETCRRKETLDIQAKPASCAEGNCEQIPTHVAIETSTLSESLEIKTELPHSSDVITTETAIYKTTVIERQDYATGISDYDTTISFETTQQTEKTSEFGPHKESSVSVTEEEPKTTESSSTDNEFVTESHTKSPVLDSENDDIPTKIPEEYITESHQTDIEPPQISTEKQSNFETSESDDSKYTKPTQNVPETEEHTVSVLLSDKEIPMKQPNTNEPEEVLATTSEPKVLDSEKYNTEQPEHSITEVTEAQNIESHKHTSFPDISIAEHEQYTQGPVYTVSKSEDNTIQSVVENAQEITTEYQSQAVSEYESGPKSTTLTPTDITLKESDEKVTESEMQTGDIEIYTQPHISSTISQAGSLELSTQENTEAYLPDVTITGVEHALTTEPSRTTDKVTYVTEESLISSETDKIQKPVKEHVTGNELLEASTTGTVDSTTEPSISDHEINTENELLVSLPEEEITTEVHKKTDTESTPPSIVDNNDATVAILPEKEVTESSSSAPHKIDDEIHATTVGQDVNPETSEFLATADLDRITKTPHGQVSTLTETTSEKSEIPFYDAEKYTDVPIEPVTMPERTTKLPEILSHTKDHSSESPIITESQTDKLIEDYNTDTTKQEEPEAEFEAQTEKPGPLTEESQPATIKDETTDSGIGKDKIEKPTLVPQETSTEDTSDLEKSTEYGESFATQPELHKPEVFITEKAESTTVLTLIEKETDSDSPDIIPVTDEYDSSVHVHKVESTTEKELFEYTSPHSYAPEKQESEISYTEKAQTVLSDSTTKPIEAFTTEQSHEIMYTSTSPEVDQISTGKVPDIKEEEAPEILEPTAITAVDITKADEILTEPPGKYNMTEDLGTKIPDDVTQQPEFVTDIPIIHAITSTDQYLEVPELIPDTFVTEPQDTSEVSNQVQVTEFQTTVTELEHLLTTKHPDIEEPVKATESEPSTDIPKAPTEILMNQNEHAVTPGLLATTEETVSTDREETILSSAAPDQALVTEIDTVVVTESSHKATTKPEEASTYLPHHDSSEHGGTQKITSAPLTEEPTEVSSQIPDSEKVDQEDTATKSPEQVANVDSITPFVESHTVPQETATDIMGTELSTEPAPQVASESHYEDELTKPTSMPNYELPETTPYLIELQEHTHKTIEITTASPSEDEITTEQIVSDIKHEHIVPEIVTDASIDKETEDQKPSKHYEETSTLIDISEKTTLPTISKDGESLQTTQTGDIDIKETTIYKDQDFTTQLPTKVTEIEKESTPESAITLNVDKIITSEKPIHSDLSMKITTPEETIIPSTEKITTAIAEESPMPPPVPADKITKPEAKPIEPSTSLPDLSKPVPSEMQPTDEVPSPDEEAHFPPSGSSGYGNEPDYVEEDQAFGPGTCRYGGKVYVSAQQIPRDDPCDFCFCFRSDIICLQQSCPPPIHGCHEEPIQGFCCPRYECPVSMATTLNVTTTTTTTTTTLPPHFPTHSYKGAAQRRGCQIKGHTYKVGEVVRGSSGPCLHCTCGGDGQMKCDPKACTPEPMLRQMIAAAVSAKRRR